MRFKVGDTVEVVGNVGNHGFKIGEEVKIEKVFDTNDRNNHYGAEGKSGYWFIKDVDLKLVRETKPPKPPKFLLQYELDEDPVEYFETLPLLKKRLKELVKDSTLKRHTVRVIEIAKEYDVEIKDNISIKIK